MGCNFSSKAYNILEKPEEKQSNLETNSYINGLLEANIDFYSSKLKNSTLIQTLQEKLLLHKERPFLGYRKQTDYNIVEGEYKYFTYNEVNTMSSALARFLIQNQNDYTNEIRNYNNITLKLTGIFARNCPEWAITDIALQKSGITSVAFSTIFGDEEFDFIMQQTEIMTMFISPDNIETFINLNKKYSFSYLKNLVIFNTTQYFKTNITNSIIDQLKELNFNVVLFSDIINDKANSNTQIKLTPQTTNSILTLNYTPGNNEPPKGAMLTQKAFAANLNILEDIGYTDIDIEEDSLFSFLPMIHALERNQLYVTANYGLKICYFSSTDIKSSLLDDLVLAKPSILLTSPSILINFRQVTLEHFSLFEGKEKGLLEEAIKTKRRNFFHQNKINHVFYDTHVFKDVRNRFGGKLKLIISSFAPLPKDISSDIKVLFSIPIVEIYGMTELTGIALHTNINEISNDNCGGVTKCLRMKMVSRHDINLSTNITVKGENIPEGELCFNGITVFAGYFRNEERTKAILDDKGWLHTGDVGKLDESSKGIKIIGRVNEIFKLSTGETIAPSRLESIYIRSALVKQIMITSLEEKSYILAIVVVSIKEIYSFLKTTGLLKKENKNMIIDSDADDNKESSQVTMKKIVDKYLNYEEVVNCVSTDLKKLANEKCLKGHEIPGKLILSTYEFTRENGCLNSSLGLVRSRIKTQFNEEIELAYLK